MLCLNPCNNILDSSDAYLDEVYSEHLSKIILNQFADIFPIFFQKVMFREFLEEFRK